MIRYIVGGLILTLCLLGAVAFLLSSRDDSVSAGLSLSDAIDGGIAEEEAAAGFAYERAIEPRAFRFPADHGPHNRYKLEWWYFTGNLDSPDGRHFGYQLTFFRTALSPTDSTKAGVDSSADWNTNQLYLAHFALTDVRGKRFSSFEKYGRGAAGIAGARAEPFRVWIDDWEVTGEGNRDTFPMQLRAHNGDMGIDLTLSPEKPVILQGEEGLSTKGVGEGQASYYYSFTRLASSGSVTADGKSMPVNGLSWLDREWSTSLLGRTQVGWDWFSIQLDDGSDLMFFRLREEGSSAEEFRDGTLIDAAGNSRRFDASTAVLDELGVWRNDQGVDYPSGWRLRIPEADIDLTVEPYMDDQELELSIRYWEGAVRVSGTRNGRTVAGSGYVELTGYADVKASAF